uniref:Uncharacterized protein n=1 Tax=Chromera velia CCMP2878 TaxID=1169474 RepID=A0A0G4HXX9_9ALVE|eukprot:Cvel_9375.t1-p1 / transcript=Cvel_9375.t1 / gene=Cvel_9375 / organism=Chromera_velia_CCMP2878 / gene_product=E3 ubiquitin-protein ligase Hakai, putative / transcript_product=E3 ubiquitin-protein ligase Hakai, putative / location=Cvel_scaffold538:60697-65225(-) / protein_length=1230 / sequence_SO=supercontig / SO=protein_coding / is_pseudo=false
MSGLRDLRLPNNTMVERNPLDQATALRRPSLNILRGEGGEQPCSSSQRAKHNREKPLRVLCRTPKTSNSGFATRTQTSSSRSGGPVLEILETLERCNQLELRARRQGTNTARQASKKGCTKRTGCSICEHRGKGRSGAKEREREREKDSEKASRILERQLVESLTSQVFFFRTKWEESLRQLQHERERGFERGRRERETSNKNNHRGREESSEGHREGRGRREKSSSESESHRVTFPSPLDLSISHAAHTDGSARPQAASTSFHPSASRASCEEEGEGEVDEEKGWIREDRPVIPCGVSGTPSPPVPRHGMPLTCLSPTELTCLSPTELTDRGRERTERSDEREDTRPAPLRIPRMRAPPPARAPSAPLDFRERGSFGLWASRLGLRETVGLSQRQKEREGERGGSPETSRRTEWIEGGRRELDRRHETEYTQNNIPFFQLNFSPAPLASFQSPSRVPAPSREGGPSYAGGGVRESHRQTESSNPFYPSPPLSSHHNSREPTHSRCRSELSFLEGTSEEGTVRRIGVHVQEASPSPRTPPTPLTDQNRSPCTPLTVTDRDQFSPPPPEPQLRDDLFPLPSPIPHAPPVYPASVGGSEYDSRDASSASSGSPRPISRERMRNPPDAQLPGFLSAPQQIESRPLQRRATEEDRSRRIPPSSSSRDKKSPSALSTSRTLTDRSQRDSGASSRNSLAAAAWSSLGLPPPPQGLKFPLCIGTDAGIEGESFDPPLSKSSGRPGEAEGRGLSEERSSRERGRDPCNLSGADRKVISERNGEAEHNEATVPPIGSSGITAGPPQQPTTSDLLGETTAKEEDENQKENPNRQWPTFIESPPPLASPPRVLHVPVNHYLLGASRVKEQPHDREAAALASVLNPPPQTEAFTFKEPTRSTDKEDSSKVEPQSVHQPQVNDHFSNRRSLTSSASTANANLRVPPGPAMSGVSTSTHAHQLPQRQPNRLTHPAQLMPGHQRPASAPKFSIPLPFPARAGFAVSHRFPHPTLPTHSPRVLCPPPPGTLMVPGGTGGLLIPSTSGVRAPVPSRFSPRPVWRQTPHGAVLDSAASPVRTEAPEYSLAGVRSGPSFHNHIQQKQRSNSQGATHRTVSTGQSSSPNPAPTTKWYFAPTFPQAQVLSPSPSPRPNGTDSRAAAQPLTTSGPQPMPHGTRQTRQFVGVTPPAPHAVFHPQLRSAFPPHPPPFCQVPPTASAVSPVCPQALQIGGRGGPPPSMAFGRCPR